MTVTFPNTLENAGLVTTFEGTKTSSTAFNYFSDSFQAGDVLVIGRLNKFKDIVFNVGTPMAADAIEFIWQYSTGSTTWATLAVDNPDALTKSGSQRVNFTPPAGWIGNVSTGYLYVRLRIVSVTNPTEGGAQQTDRVKTGRYNVLAVGTENFANLVTADLAGTYTILQAVTPATGITGIAECPTNIINQADTITFTLAGCTLGAGDTVDITGIDWAGKTISESVDVSGGNGSYTSTISFRNVTQIDCNGFSDGTITAVLDRWGLIGFNQSTYQYNIWCYLEIGDGSTTTVFSDTNKQITFGQFFWFLLNGSTTTLTLGLTATSYGITYGYAGCQLTFLRNWQSHPSNTVFLMGSTPTMNLYGCNVSLLGGSYYHLLSEVPYYCTMNMIDTFIYANVSVGGIGMVKGTKILTRCVFVPYYYAVNGVTSPALTDCIFPVVTTINAVSGYTFLGGKIGYFQDQQDGTRHRYLKNVDFDPDNYKTQYYGPSGANSYTYIQYSFDLKVFDNNGNGVENANVVINDIDGTEIFSGVTDSDGDITQQWLVGQQHYLKAPPGGPTEINEWQVKTPHTVTISASGYATRVVQYTMDRKREEVEMLDLESPTVPDAPSGLAATAASQTQIDLAWTDNSDDETGFRIERSPNGTSLWTHIATAAAGATSYSDSGLSCGTTYYYRVAAVNDVGLSDYSAVAGAATAACTVPVVLIELESRIP